LLLANTNKSKEDSVEKRSVSTGVKGICLALCLFLSLPALFAHGQDCASQPNTVAIEECQQKRYEKADRELNRVYGEIMKDLSPEGQKKLKEAQRAWLKYRDSAYAFGVEFYKESRSYGRVAFAEYKAAVVEKRILELKYIIQSPEDPPVKW
jgi:uncharacterized protein YecT (DUF1311 family)